MKNTVFSFQRCYIKKRATIFRYQTLSGYLCNDVKRLDSFNILRLKTSVTDGVQILTLFLETLDWGVCVL